MQLRVRCSPAGVEPNRFCVKCNYWIYITLPVKNNKVGCWELATLRGQTKHWLCTLSIATAGRWQPFPLTVDYFVSVFGRMVCSWLTLHREQRERGQINSSPTKPMFTVFIVYCTMWNVTVKLLPICDRWCICHHVVLSERDIECGDCHLLSVFGH